MLVMENCVFNKLYLENNAPIRIHITLVDNSLKLIILQNENAWKSFVISENLSKFAIQHKLNLEDYIEKLIEYAKNGNSNVAFVMTDEEFIINRLLSDNLKVKYFTCTLEKVNYVDYVEKIMDILHAENLKYAEKLNYTIKEKNEIETYKINCELQLKELIEKKRSDEEELFGRFVLILNEKKHRIQHLTELLEAFKAGRPTVNPVITKTRKTKLNVKEQSPPAKKLETISDSEPSTNSNSNSDTEDNYNSEEEPSASNEEHKPSTSIQTFNFLEDDCAQTPVLPKRMKRDIVTDKNLMVIPSTSKASEVVVDDPTDDTFAKTSKKESAAIDFNTQQLLDML